MFEEFANYIRDLDKPHLYIILHNSADPDAIASGFALGYLSQLLNKDCTYSVSADGLNQSSKNALNDMEFFHITEELPHTQYDKVIITLDTANFIQLGKYEDWYNTVDYPRIVIDHHATKELSENTIMSILDESVASTCIMITEAYITLQEQPTPNIATLLIMGHLYDSRRFFTKSTARTFELIAQLIRWGGNYDQANEYLQNIPTFSERVAKIKSCNKIKYKYHDDKIIVTSSIGAYEASAARGFITMGADATLVLSVRDTEIRGSARSGMNSGVNVAELIAILMKEFDGQGGGHANAAGFNIQRKLSKKEQTQIRDRFIELASAQIKNL